jgi:polysaccharide deacetylase family protein (PEP-CTERM system associated)
MKNAISIDLEDWYCANNITQVVKRENWRHCESRIQQTTRRLLDLLRAYETRATFFVLGWVAERHPELVHEIEESGHEIGVHGYHHLLLTEVTPAEFERDLTKALETLEHCGIAQAVIGFRAPSFTIVKQTEWALEILERYGIRYDTSVFPVSFHPDYGVASAPLVPYKITDRLYEFPLSCLEVAGVRIPFGGGAYFRLLPYACTKYCINKCNTEGRAVVFYLHPWELDPQQPRIELPWLNKIRHYYNLHKTEARLETLLQDFQFTTVREVLAL